VGNYQEEGTAPICQIKTSKALPGGQVVGNHLMKARLAPSGTSLRRC
jgi:hypothetical protein